MNHFMVISQKKTFQSLSAFCNGGGNYGVNRHARNKEKEVFAIVGYFVNKDNEPQYSKDYLPTLIHEFNHSFINYLLDESKYPNHVEELEKLLQICSNPLNGLCQNKHTELEDHDKRIIGTCRCHLLYAG